MRIGALEFFTEGAGGRPFIPTRAWAIPDPDGGRKLEDWALSLEAPPDNTPAHELHDLKRWLLFGKEDARHWVLGTDRRRNVDARSIRREDAGEMYVRGLLSFAQPEISDRGVTVLMPALDDEVIRQRYLRVIETAVPGARVLPEPEMVVEYFRLVRRSLVLDRDQNNVILVIDLGASTTDLSVVVSNRGGTVVGGDTARRRAGRLQAIQGSSSEIAGKWVDEQLSRKLGLDISGSDAARLLDEIEAAKVEVSQTGRPVDVGGARVTVHTLRDVALDVVSELEPVVDVMRRRLWEQVTGTDYAANLSQQVRVERGVRSEKEVLRLVDHVLLAGGTSRLPGLRAALETLIDADRLTIHEVGDAFPVAAAVGALAHVMRSKYDPPRLRSAAEASGASTAAEADLEGALDVDIELEWRANGDLKAHREVVLSRGDPLAYQGGERADVIGITAKRGDAVRARFVPNVDDKELRRGMRPDTLRATSANPRVGIRVDSGRRLHLRSDQLRNAELVWLDLNRFDQRRAAPLVRFDQDIPQGAVALDHADEVVIDFGMSKSVVVGARSGLLFPAALDAACRGAVPDPAPSERPQAEQGEVIGLENEPAEPVVSAGVAEDAATIGADEGSSRGSIAVDVEAAPVVAPPEEPDPQPAQPPEPARSHVAAGMEGAGADEHAPAVPEAPAETAPAPPQPATLEPPSTSPIPSTAMRWERRMAPLEFGETLQQIAQAAGTANTPLPIEDLTLALMALSVRDFVLLAGPPGCGKSSLVRTIAQLLGLTPGRDFVEVAVQAHWMDDAALFDASKGVIARVNADCLLLFDEFNLTRPEYYLSRVFHAAVASHADEIPRGWRAFGTLNIDDTSRPPSPKVLDRCMLLEIDQAAWSDQAREMDVGALPRLVSIADVPPGGSVRDARIDRCIVALESAVQRAHLRQDLLPSWRVRSDIERMLALHEAGELESRGLLTRTRLVDRLVASRVLVKLSGAYEQVLPVLDALEPVVDEMQELTQTRRRIMIARQQRLLGFVSPWQ